MDVEAVAEGMEDQRFAAVARGIASVAVGFAAIEAVASVGLGAPALTWAGAVTAIAAAGSLVAARVGEHGRRKEATAGLAGVLFAADLLCAALLPGLGAMTTLPLVIGLLCVPDLGPRGGRWALGVAFGVSALVVAIDHGLSPPIGVPPAVHAGIGATAQLAAVGLAASIIALRSRRLEEAVVRSRIGEQRLATTVDSITDAVVSTD
ncbi:MAG: hypothetical protein ABMB14_11880, partial [Myxococcota bacterium]